MNLSALFANSYKVIDNTEPVTLFRKTGDGTFDSGTAVADALRQEVVKEGVKIKGRLSWVVWASQAGTLPAKPGDYVVDGSGIKWVVSAADIRAFGQRYHLETLQEH